MVAWKWFAPRPGWCKLGFQCGDIEVVVGPYGRQLGNWGLLPSGQASGILLRPWPVPVNCYKAASLTFPTLWFPDSSSDCSLTHDNDATCHHVTQTQEPSRVQQM